MDELRDKMVSCPGHVFLQLSKPGSVDGGTHACHGKGFSVEQWLEEVTYVPGVNPLDMQGAQPFADGMCNLNLTQYNNCDDPSTNMFATIAVVDPNKQQVASEQNMQSINDANPWNFDLSPYGRLRITGEHNNDYVQFNLGNQAWRSDNQDQNIGKSFCMTIGWSNTIPNCNSIFEKNLIINRIVMCTFACNTTAQV